VAAGKGAWRSVRAQRSSPPGLAEVDDEPRAVFQAALAQSEELWDAAATSSAASRPLPLFYCLSQASRAVCAAWTLEAEWRPESHGLRRRVSNDPTPLERVFNYATSLSDRPLGNYQMTAEATMSTTFEGEASVAELWASLPGFPTPHGIFGDRERSLVLEPVQVDDGRPLFARIASPTHGAFPYTRAAFDELPALYPTTTGIVQDGTRETVFGGEEPVFKFLREDGSPRPLHEVGVRPYYSDDSFGNLVVRPKVGTDPIGPPSEFLTLWALLFCLSELARYYPDTWVGALDLDRSTGAVTLEHGLDLALERAPALISDALTGPVTELMRQELRRRELEAAEATGEEVPEPADEPEAPPAE
jgi:hypothetical protein